MGDAGGESSRKGRKSGARTRMYEMKIAEIRELELYNREKGVLKGGRSKERRDTWGNRGGGERRPETERDRE